MKVNKPATTSEHIIHWHQKNQKASYGSFRLGASSIGKPCARQLWYAFRWSRVTFVNGRIARLFKVGNRAEPELVKEVQRIGGTVKAEDPATGRQLQWFDHGGHFTVKIDGIAYRLPEFDDDEPTLLEFKSAKNTAFNAMVRHGITAKEPGYVVQAQIGMHYSGAKRALILVEGKNDSDLHSEIIQYDETASLEYIARAKRIIESDSVPPRAGGSPDDFICRFCQYAEICHGKSLPQVSCRSCAFATARTDEGSTAARWSCELRDKARLTIAEQRAGCEQHVMSPGFYLNGVEAVDAGKDWVDFLVDNTYTVRNGGDHVRSTEFFRQLNYRK